MKIEKSNVSMMGICLVQTDKCTAKKVGPITAVWVEPTRRQLDVCDQCLKVKLDSGEWTEVTEEP